MGLGKESRQEGVGFGRERRRGWLSTMKED